jgi:hypothetical protein
VHGIGLRLRVVLVVLLVSTSGCFSHRALAFDPLDREVAKSRDRVLVSGWVNYRCLVPRRAGSGVLVRFMDEDGRVLSTTETGPDGSFVLTTPQGLDPTSRVYLEAGDVRSDKLPALFDGHYTAVVNAACPELEDPVHQGQVAARPGASSHPEARAPGAPGARRSWAGPVELGLPDPSARPVPR